MYSHKRAHIFGQARTECFITFARGNEIVYASIVANKVTHNVANVYAI